MVRSLETRRAVFKEKSKAWNPEPLHEFFFRMAKQYKNHEYIVSQEQIWTYSNVSDKSKQLAVGLINLGLKRHEHVALIFPNHPEFVVSKYGISAACGVAVPLNYRLKKEEFKYLINQSDSSLMIILDVWNNVNFVSMLKELCPEVFEGKRSKEFPHLREIIVFSPQGKKYAGTTDFYELINSTQKIHIEEMLSQRKGSKVDEVTDIMYTSGTTSLPKGVLVTHDMVWRSALGSCINRGYQEGRRIFVPIPFYHCFGYIEGIIAASMVGGTIILQVDFNESQALKLIEMHEANDILCVPTIGLRLLESQRRQPHDLSRLEAMYCAGAEVSPKMWKDLKTELEIEELITGYGMTECSAGILQTDPNDDLLRLSRFVGRVIPGGHVGIDELGGKNIQFKVRNIDTGQYEPHGVEGELVCKGPLVTSGYYNKCEETTNSIDNNGWLKTGDLAVIDSNGYISLTGRIKEIYRIGAENVAPKEIEDVLTSHHKISQAYVIGVPDTIMGEVGMAWIVLEPGMTLNESDVFEYASNYLAKFKIPKYIKFVQQDKLPLTATGKLQKFKLKELYMNEQQKVQSLFN